MMGHQQININYTKFFPGVRSRHREESALWSCSPVHLEQVLARALVAAAARKVVLVPEETAVPRLSKVARRRSSTRPSSEAPRHPASNSRKISNVTENYLTPTNASQKSVLLAEVASSLWHSLVAKLRATSFLRGTRYPSRFLTERPSDVQNTEGDHPVDISSTLYHAVGADTLGNRRSDAQRRQEENGVYGRWRYFHSFFLSFSFSFNSSHDISVSQDVREGSGTSRCRMF